MNSFKKNKNRVNLIPMNKFKKISKEDLIKESWNIIFPSYMLFFIVLMIFWFCLQIMLSTIQSNILENINPQSVLFIISAYLFQMGLGLGFYKICLNIVQQKEINFKQLFASFYLLITNLLAQIIYYVIILLSASPGLLLFYLFIKYNINYIFIILPILIIIIPAFYISIRLSFYQFFILDTECSAITSLIRSAQITQNNVLQLFTISLLFSLIILISLIPLLTGLLVSIPLISIASTLLYVKLK